MSLTTIGISFIQEGSGKITWLMVFFSWPRKAWFLKKSRTSRDEKICHAFYNVPGFGLPTLIIVMIHIIVTSYDLQTRSFWTFSRSQPRLIWKWHQGHSCNTLLQALHRQRELPVASRAIRVEGGKKWGSSSKGTVDGCEVRITRRGNYW